MRNVVDESTAAISYPEMLRQQQLQACQMALEALQQDDRNFLRGFTSEMLKLSPAWEPMVSLALWADEKGLRQAVKPFAWLRAIAWREAKRWNPMLLGRRTGPRRRRETVMTEAVSTRLPHMNYQDAVDALVPTQADDVHGMDLGDLDKALRVSPEPADHVFELGGRVCVLFGLRFNWAEICRRLGMDAEETAVMTARAYGVTRARMAAYLNWTHGKAEGVWKKVYRRLSEPGMRRHAEQTLAGSWY